MLSCRKERKISFHPDVKNYCSFPFNACSQENNKKVMHLKNK